MPEGFAEDFTFASCSGLCTLDSLDGLREYAQGQGVTHLSVRTCGGDCAADEARAELQQCSSLSVAGTDDGGLLDEGGGVVCVCLRSLWCLMSGDRK